MVVCSPQGASALAGTLSPSRGFKTRLLGEGFHTLINGGLFSSPTNVEHHNPPPFGAQRPRWGFKTRLLGEGFHTLINGGLFSSPTNVEHHNPPPFGAQRPRWHSFLPPIDVEPPPNPPPLGPSVLTGTPPCVYPLRGTARRLAHCPVSGSDTICNDPDPPLADIVLLGLSLSGFPFRASPQSFKTRLLGQGFHTLINDVLFSSPTNMG